MYPRKNKYGNYKVLVDGITFDSRKEAKRYHELKLLAAAGTIIDLELQRPFELVPKQKDERAVTYKADFSYKENNHEVVEDTKGFRTADYIIKRKLFKLRYPHIDFREL